MKSFTLLVVIMTIAFSPLSSTLTHALPPPARNGLNDTHDTHDTLSPRNPVCRQRWTSYFVDYCDKYPAGNLLINDFWLIKSRDLDPERWYDNYEKIICSDNPAMHICAFIKGATHQVRGDQVQRLIEHLAIWCNESRCARCAVSEVHGLSTSGEIKIDGVKSMATCSGVCEPKGAGGSSGGSAQNNGGATPVIVPP